MEINVSANSCTSRNLDSNRIDPIPETGPLLSRKFGFYIMVILGVFPVFLGIFKGCHPV
jgi:hypothetical protein